MIRHRMLGPNKQSQTGPGGARGRHRRRHWVLEGLEGRTLLSGSPTIYTVDLTSDTGTGSAGAGDLLYCVTQADANTNTAGSEIEFDPMVFAAATPQTITLSSTLDLGETDGPEMIENTGPKAVTISGNDVVEVFSVASGVTATLTGLTISSGVASASSGGGGINNAGTLTLDDGTVSGNSAAQGGGAGIYNTGTLTVIGSTITDNTASAQAYGGGGGIYEQSGTLTVDGSTFSNNSAFDGGGIFVDGVYSGTVTISDATFSDNSAIYYYSNDGGGGQGGGIYDFGGPATTITDCIFSGNSATSGGGIEDFECPMTVSGTSFSSNSAAGNGGGLGDFQDTMTVVNSTFSSNVAAGDGGGYYDLGGTVTLTNSTVSGNSANEGGGIFDESDGLTAVNCTIAYNVVNKNDNGGGQGGGLGIAGPATLNNTIVALNTEGTGAAAPADDIFAYAYYGSITISPASANNLIGTGGGDGLTDGSKGNLVGVADPGLVTLADNGGPTQTIALLAASPAVNAGSNALAVDAGGKALTTDHRGAGFARIVDGTVDIGAFETGNPTGYLVDLTSDTGAGSGGAGDLLYCITQANANTNPAGSLIEFAPTIFNTATPRTIELSGTLELEETDGPEVIDGPGAGAVTISGVSAVQVFDAAQEDVTATLSGLTIFQGNTNQGGGGLDNDGTLTVADCIFRDNTSGADGGGIANAGTMTITDSTIDSNTAPFGGGIYNEGILTVTGSTIDGNTANNSGGYGGGVDDDDGGTATFNICQIEMNSAVHHGGGIFASGGALTVTGSTVSSNTASSGGGIFSQGVDGDSALTIADSTLSDNAATGASSGSGGGGVYNSGTASITESTFSGNTATQGGGGIFANAGAVTIMGSTLSGNAATQPFASGGGLYENGGTLTVADSTIADNSAAYVGAGMDVDAGTLEAVNCTIAGNIEPSNLNGMGGGLNVDQGTATLDNTIIALNTDGTGPVAQPDNLYLNGDGTVATASAYNLIGAGGGNSGLTNDSNGNQVGVADPGLGVLADNGGPTQTIALLTGSPAIDAGNNALAVDAKGNPLATDQRGAGFPRISNGTVDIGAFEGSVNPTVYIVDLTSDAGAGSGNDGDLLYCITQANANTNSGGSEIEFDPTVFSAAAPQTIELTSTLELGETAGPEVIDGPGTSIATVSGNNTVEVFQVAGGATATLTGLTISDGVAASGGGIGNGGTLTVTGCTLSGNQATSGGAIDNEEGALTVTGDTIENNSAFATSTSAGYGGGIDNNGGTVTITGTTLANNEAADFTSDGGGIENNGGLMTITDSTLSGNSALGTTSDGGGIDNEGTGYLSIGDSTLSGNSAFAGGGGGIFNGKSGVVTITDTSIVQNSTGSGTASGGGVNNQGTMTVIDSTIANNAAAGIGGGIDNQSGGTLSAANSTLADNSGYEGGGGIGSQGELTAVNCTIVDNSFGNGAGYGGGIGIDGGTATLNNTIVAINTNGTGTGAPADDIDTIGGGTATGSSNLVGTEGTVGLTNGVNGNQVGVANPGLGTLASNGGPTQTIALLAGSPAINAGSTALSVAAGLTTDQRGAGFLRVVDGTIDIGAFEIQAVTANPAPTLSTITPDGIAVGDSNSVTLTVTGSSFISRSVVDWSSSALSTTYVSPTELTATIPASDLAAPGSFSITVTNPAPGGGTSTAATFLVLAVPTSVYVDASYAADATATVVTWSDGSKHTVGYDAFGTVQAGVTAVASGGTVHIAAGTYTEAVTVPRSLTLAGAGQTVTTIQIPASLQDGDAITLASGASVAMSSLSVANGPNGALNATGIMDNNAALVATDIGVAGFTAGVTVRNNGAATITDSTIVDNNNGIDVGSSTSDTSSLTANNDNLAGDSAGVANIQSSGTIVATLNWWGTTSGPLTSANPGGTGSEIAGTGNVRFSPWLGDANFEPDDYLVFSTTAGSQYVVTPNSGDTALDVTSGSLSLGSLGGIFGSPSLGTITGGDQLGFAGNGGTITINGETILNDFSIMDASVQYDVGGDGLDGTTIHFIGTGMTRDVQAQGVDNSFSIQGAGVSGPSGDLEGDSGTNQFVFNRDDTGGGRLLGNIQGGGSSTLDYSNYPTGADVDLGNGSDGTATGVVGSVSGITAIIGSSFNDDLGAGSVPDVTLTDLGGTNNLTGTGAGDTVVGSNAPAYTLTDGLLASLGVVNGTDIFLDYLHGIRAATLTGGSFDVSGWTGTASLSDPSGSGTVTADKDADFYLDNTSLSSSDGMSLGLSGITSADLTVTAVAGDPSLIIDASTFSGTTNLSATGTVDAILYGGYGGHGTLTAAGSGKDILIGEAGDSTLTDTGSGRNILIGGGPGGDTLVGNGNDILVGGTTDYDSDTGAHIAALDAILAEWSSSEPYAKRIKKINQADRRGGLHPAYAFNSHTIQKDRDANTLSDRATLLLPGHGSNDWFIVSKQDHVTKKPNETRTLI